MEPETHCPRGSTAYFIHSHTQAGPCWGTSRVAHFSTGNTLSQGATPLFHSFGHGGHPLRGHKQGGTFWRLKHIIPRGPPLISFLGSWMPPPRVAQTGWHIVAPETHCLTGATPFFIHWVMKATPLWGTNRLVHSGTRNASPHGGHPFFHSFRHPGCPPRGSQIGCRTLGPENQQKGEWQ